MPHPKNLVLPDFARYFFTLAVVAILVLFVWIISPFFTTLIFAGTIAVVFSPVHNFLERYLKNYPTFASFLSTLFVLVAVLVPLTLFAIFLGNEAVNAYDLLSSKWTLSNVDKLQWDGLQELPIIGNFLEQIANRYGFSSYVYETRIDLVEWVKIIGQAISGFLVAESATIVGAVGTTVLSLFIMVLTIFFFFRDGRRFISTIKTLSPLPTRYEVEIENKLRDTTYAIVVGTFGTALVQGFVATIGFAIAGVGNLVLWFALMSFSALIPYVGPVLVWLPISIALIVQGNLFWGGFVFLWGLCIVSVIDNIVRPLFIESTTKTHSLVTFLAVLGGIFVFGMKGIVFGPLILSLTITILHIYQLEYKEMLRE